MKCRCGCDGEAAFLCSGTDYGGEKFVNEPACYSATCYLEESAHELGLPFRKVTIPESYQRHLGGAPERTTGHSSL